MMAAAAGNGSSSASASASATSARSSRQNKAPWHAVLLVSAVTVGLLQVLLTACREAYQIRLYAITEYGRIIHEFDPYFNYRATEYLWQHGWIAFKQWFDYMSWYPLGRPVGTTIYPGMQITTVLLKKWVVPHLSINDICVFVPAWFGVTATLAVFALTLECTRHDDSVACLAQSVPLVRELYRYLWLPIWRAMGRLVTRTTGSTWGGLFVSPTATTPKKSSSTLTPLCCATCAACVMAVVPAHLLRSIGGGYDNESIAMTAMVVTFACWTRAMRHGCAEYVTITWGVLTGLAYFYMVAAWGGYVFVLNTIGVHAALLVLLGRYSTKLHRAYTFFYVVGTMLACQVPVVGWQPLRSLEQMGPLVAFLGLQLIEVCEHIGRRHCLLQGQRMTAAQMWKLRLQVFAAAGVLGACVVLLLMPTGYFGPISSRVRGLFVQHTKTGNPLVDSVAEHQAASPEAYRQYLHKATTLAPIGFAMTMLFFNDSSSFLLVYGVVAYYFSHKMVRLILLTAPIGSALAGIAVGRFVGWALQALLAQPVDLWSYVMMGENDDAHIGSAVETDATKNGNSKASAAAAANGKSPSKTSNKKGKTIELKNAAASTTASTPEPDTLLARGMRVLLAAAVIYQCIPLAQDFYRSGHEMARHVSHPTIVQKASRQDTGKEVIIDDYRQAYFWLRDNTPEDARVMAWWDYGYQITGIANRTTIADGNTWNHEHIALLGRTLTAPEKEGHRIARHMADYLLVWAGGGGDDLAKSPHLRRIANSVYRGLCKEPTCREFGFFSDRTPTPDMKESLLFKLVANGQQEAAVVDRNRFREVYASKYGKVRIYKIQSVSKESKEWVADPANRLCDAPGSWFCRGQYPPALKKVLKEKKDFKQLEDFNFKGSEEDSEYNTKYQQEYMENLNNKKRQRDRQAGKPSPASAADADRQHRVVRLSPTEINELNDRSKWQDSEITSLVYELIQNDDAETLAKLMAQTPDLPHVRSSDGRGPMWWAYEFGRKRIISMLEKMDVSDELQDANGVTARQMKST